MVKFSSPHSGQPAVLATRLNLTDEEIQREKTSLGAKWFVPN